MVVLHLLRVGYEILIEAKESRFVKHGEEWCPFLEIDIHASIREQPRRRPDRPRLRVRDQRIASLDVKKGLRVEFGARLADFLDLAFKCLCGDG